MANEIIKKNGIKEMFEPDKIRTSITKAIERVNMPERRKDEVVEEVSEIVIANLKERGDVESSEVRESILSELDRVAPAVSNAWREYEENKIRE
jgi:transcriptional regulator NrdR family protein